MARLLSGAVAVFLSCAFLLCGCGSENDVDKNEFARHFRYDPELGYSLEGNVRARHKQVLRGETLFDVTYTINGHGFRESFGPKSGRKAVLFFGDSTTFGLGVADHEVYVALVQKRLGPAFQALNLAGPGYGPHHMLRLLELAREKTSVGDAVPVAGYYFCIPDHVPRAAGRRFWDLSGPHYEVDEVDQAVHQGSFEPLWYARSVRRLGNIPVLTGLVDRLVSSNAFRSAEDDEKDMRRFGAIVARAKQLFEARYSSPFHVLLWPRGTPEATEIAKELKRRSVPYITLEAIAAEADAQPGKLTLRNDPHMNSVGHAMAAEFIYKHLTLKH